MFGLFDKSKTFKPVKSHDKGTKRYNLHKQAKATLGSGNLKSAVKIPPGEDINEWLAVNKTIKKPIKCSAPEYVDFLMSWVQNRLDDETIFPSRVDVPFPKTFPTVVKTIFKKLFRIYAHIYTNHFDKIMQLGEEAHLNTCFKHFYYFIDEFQLVEKRELTPLADLIRNLTSK